MVIPGHLLRQFAPRVDSSVAVTFGSTPLHRMFYNVADAWSADAHRLRPSARDLLGEKLVELLSLVIDGADHTSGESVIRSAHFSRIDKIIEQNYANPLLGIRSLSAQTSLSARSIQAILKAQGTTLTRLIKERRIAEALRLPSSRDGRHRSAHAIAHAVGYRSFELFCKDMEAIGGTRVSERNE